MNVNAKLNVVLAMHVFARVVEAGTFTRAADSLKMPKATVTKLVQGLENHLRVRLLNRTTRRVTVTPDGSAYYERAVRLLGDLEDIESSVSNAQANPKGRLRIDVGGSLASLFLIRRLPDFIERYPEIQVELGVSDRPVDLVGENIDCVIRGGPLTEQSLVARHVGDFPFVTCATPAYLARHGTPTHPSDFESQHFVVSRLSALTGRPFPLVFERDGKRFEIEGRHRLAVNESNAHLAAALPYCMSMEVVDPHAVQGVFTTDVAIEDGWAVVGDRPGHGLLIDRDALTKSSIGRASGVGRVA